VKAVIKFFSMAELPVGGLVAVFEGIRSKFFYETVDDSEVMIATLLQTYNKILSEEGIRQAMSEFRKMCVFGYMLQLFEIEGIKNHFGDFKTDCLMKCCVFMRSALGASEIYRHKLFEYGRIKAYVEERPLIKKGFTFYPVNYDPLVLEPKNGIHVFLDHCIAISPTRVDIERFKEKIKDVYKHVIPVRSQDHRGDTLGKQNRVGRGGPVAGSSRLQQDDFGYKDRTFDHIPGTRPKGTLDDRPGPSRSGRSGSLQSSQGNWHDVKDQCEQAARSHPGGYAGFKPGSDYHGDVRAKEWQNLRGFRQAGSDFGGRNAFNWRSNW